MALIALPGGQPGQSCLLAGCAIPGQAQVSRRVAVQGRCGAVLMMQRQVALLPAMEAEVLDARLHASDPAALQRSNGLPATLGNACALDLAKLGVQQVK